MISLYFFPLVVCLCYYYVHSWQHLFIRHYTIVVFFKHVIYYVDMVSTCTIVAVLSYSFLVVIGACMVRIEVAYGKVLLWARGERVI